MPIQNIKITKIRGLSLIELMVALLIVTVLLLGVTTVYRASKRSYQLNDETADLQENARFTLNNIVKEIRMAGYTGCESIKDVQLNILSKTPPAGFDIGFNADTFVTGHNDTLNNWAANSIPKPGNLVPNTDAITIRKASVCSAALTAPAAPNASLAVAGNCNFQQGDVLIITDCESAEMFTVSSINKDGQLVHAGKDNTAPPVFSKAYSTNASIHRPELVSYFIGTSPQPGVARSLFQIRYQNLGGVVAQLTTELVPNIENMAITYGIDLTGNGSVDVFRPADQVDAELIQKKDPSENTPWARVVSVNLRFLTASNAVGAATEEKSYWFNGVFVANPGDSRYRREFITAINLRNNTP